MPEVIAFSLPGPLNHLKNFRMPFTTLSKKNVATEVTFFKLFELWHWSMEAMFAGTWPMCRHDGSPHVDPTSKKKAGTSLGLRGLMCEVRCDWAALKEVFNFPSWREQHFCWMCRVTRETYKETHLHADWRNTRLDQWSFLELLARNGAVLNPLMGCPGMSTACFKPDWLHVCDQGISQRFAGSCFVLWLSHQPGTSQQKLDALWAKIQAWYEEKGVVDRLQNLTQKMLQSAGKHPYPKLRGSAAVVRKLVPFLYPLCQELDQTSPEVRDCTIAAKLLGDCYDALREEDREALANLPSNSRKFAALLVVLETHNASRFHVTPKLHLFQHMAESGSLPSRCWTYRDEDFGGSVAAVSRRKGGLLSPTATSAGFLEKWLILTSVTQVVHGNR